MSRLVKDSAITFVAEVLTMGSTFVLGVLTARALGTDGKGVYTLAMGAASAGALILGMRWQRPTGHFLARDQSKLGAVVGSNLLMALIATGIGFALWYIYPTLIEERVLKGVGPVVVGWTMALVGSTFLWQAITALYGGLREFLMRSVFLVVAAVVNLIPTVILFVLGEDRVAVYLGVYAASSTATYGGWLAAMLVRRRCVPSLDSGLMRRMLRYSSLTYVSLLMNMVVLRLDIFILNYLTEQTLVGIYSIAIGLSNQLGTIPTILSVVIFNRASANEIGPGGTTARAVRISLAAMVVAGAMLAVLAVFLIVPVYGSQFAPAIGPVFVMIPATILLGLFRILAADIEGRGKPGRVSLCSLFAAVLTVGLDLWWIPRYAVMGAAWASLVSYGMAFLLIAFMFCRLSDLKLRSLFLLTRADMTLLWQNMNRMLRRKSPGAAASHGT